MSVSLDKYILDRVSWLSPPVRFCFLGLLFRHFHWHWPESIRLSQDGSLERLERAVSTWVEAQTSPPKLLDYLGMVMSKFGIRCLQLVPWLQDFLLRVLTDLFTRRTTASGSGPKHSVWLSMEKKCLEVLNSSFGTFPFVDCSAAMRQLARSYLQARLERLVRTGGALSKTLTRTLSICTQQRALKPLFLEHPVLFESLVHSVESSAGKNASYVEYLAILKNLVDPCEQDSEDDQGALEKIRHVETLQKGDCEIQIETTTKSDDQRQRLELMMQQGTLDDRMRDELAHEPNPLEEALTLQFGRRLLALCNGLFDRVLASAKHKLQLRSLFQKGCLVEIVTLLLQRRAARFLNDSERVSNECNETTSQTDRLLRLFASALKLSVLEKQFEEAHSQMTWARLKTVLASVSVLVRQCSDPARFVVRHLLPLVHGLSRPQVLFAVVECVRACSELAQMRPLRSALELVCDLFSPKSEVDESLDFERIFLRLEAIYKGGELGATLSVHTEVVLSCLVRLLRCADASCRNLTLDIFTRFFETFSGTGTTTESVLQLLVPPGSASTPQPRVNFIRRVILKNLQRNLKMGVKSSQQLEPTVRALLMYTHFAERFETSGARPGVLPFRDLSRFESQLGQVFSVKASDRLTGAHGLIRQAQDKGAKGGTAKDVLIPLLERLCEVQIRAVSEVRALRGKSGQSRVDSARNLLDVLAKGVSELLTLMSPNDFKSYLKKKMKLLSDKTAQDRVGLEQAIAEETREFRIKLLLETLDGVVRAGLGQDIIERVSRTMRLKLTQRRTGSRLLDLSEWTSEAFRSEAKALVKTLTDTVDDNAHLKRLRDFTRQGLDREMAILGEKVQLQTQAGEAPHQIGLDGTTEQLHESALIEAVEDFNDAEDGFVTRVSGGEAEAETVAEHSRDFVENLLKLLLKTFFAKGQKVKRTRREKRLMRAPKADTAQLKEVFSIGEGVVKVARLLPFRRFKFEFAKVVIRLCELLGHPDQKLRTRARKTLASVVKTTGPFVFGIVLRELSENLKEGKLLFVRNYTLAFVLQEILKQAPGQGLFRCGDLDLYVELILELALEEIGGFALDNRDNQFTKGHKWKEMRSAKGGLLLHLLGRLVDVNGPALLEILSLLRDFLRSAQQFRPAILKVGSMLNQLTEGLRLNPSFSSPLAFVLAQAQLGLSSEESPSEQTPEPATLATRARRHDLQRTFEVQEGAAQGKSVRKNKSAQQERAPVISGIFCEFALRLLERALRSEDKQNLAHELGKVGVDCARAFELVCGLTLRTKDLDIKSRCLSVIWHMRALGLVSSLKTASFERVMLHCLKDLDGSRPSLVQKTFQLLPLVLTSASDLSPDSRSDILFCVKEFLYLDDSTLAVARFVEHCLSRSILASDLVGLCDSVLEALFESQNPESVGVFESVLRRMFALPLVGPGLARKFSFDLARNLDKGSAIVHAKSPLLLAILFRNQSVSECLNFLEMLVLQLEVFRANLTDASPGHIDGLFGVLIHLVHLQLVGELSPSPLPLAMDPLRSELECASQQFPGEYFCIG